MSADSKTSNNVELSEAEPFLFFSDEFLKQFKSISSSAQRALYVEPFGSLFDEPSSDTSAADMKHTFESTLDGLRSEVKETAAADSSFTEYASALQLRATGFRRMGEAVCRRVANSHLLREAKAKRAKDIACSTNGDNKSLPASLFAIEVVSHMFLFNIQTQPACAGHMLDMLSTCLEKHPALSM
jgi:hypothetical protein